MKKIIFYTSTILISTFILANDVEEIKTIEVDGTLYKVNSSSLHITPYSELVEEETKDNIDSDVDLDEKSSDSKFNLDIVKSFYFGQLVPVNNTSLLEAGSGLGITFDLPKSISVLGHDFSTSIELNSASLNGVNATDDVNLTSLTGLFTIKLSMIDLSLGFGITDHSYYALTGSLLLDLSYKLPIENSNLSLSFRLAKIVDVDKDYNFDFATQDTYGIYLKYGF